MLFKWFQGFKKKILFQIVLLVRKCDTDENKTKQNMGFRPVSVMSTSAEVLRETPAIDIRQDVKIHEEKGYSSNAGLVWCFCV